MEDARKRPRMDDGGYSPPAAASSTVKLLQTELKTLRAELDHSQSIRAIERKTAERSEARLKRQLADTYEDLQENNELVQQMREQIDNHSQNMEESRREWMERIQWYEEQAEDMESNTPVADANSDNNGRCALLQKRLDAALDQVRELEVSLKQSEEKRIRAEAKVDAAELESSNLKTVAATLSPTDVNEINDRKLRLKMAETGRINRDLLRENDSLKMRVRDMTTAKERAATSDRRLRELEKELQVARRKLEEGAEVQRQWLDFRNEIVLEGLVEVECHGNSSSAVPPEVSTVVRKIKVLKRTVLKQEELAGAHLRRCKLLEGKLNEKTANASLLEKKIEDMENRTNQLDMENRKIRAQQEIWKRESDGMRSLLSTYEQQETSANSPAKKNNVDGLELSLKSARDEIQLLATANKKLEGTVEKLESEQKIADAEHERVLDKFGKLRNALLDERAKAAAAEARACQAETLAGKGSYNSETTRVLHLKSNPLADAVRDKYQLEIDSLRRQLEELESSRCATTPATSKSRSSFGSAGTTGSRDSAVDVQKLHSRLKEQFRNQIALFRQGVYLITGFKIDMSLGESDTQIFTVRSVYGERENDHLVFAWNPKRKSKVDMLDSEMAQLLVKGPCGLYVREHGSWPGFMASVTLHLFDQQTVS
ncbi:hypothetical protein THAOC_04415 [Thalassiosira oceanica]|uniref:Spindle assembly checkpoint component MAD1 n=1 Tax=Thalassiosira oceanica TaxID=159749 RepID=K0T9Z9_THAOC|nr:hypothetical protein THAOC_04415 [Thalassiosira oceanica]|mmetsp:Transcript_21787/g.48415  ORF Transcript_21787/g.48415 Transcript_21787/m.48415 type:complete len:658 (+) Transcript_21787:96-2069(+)|eukprot:EJK73939.1 hypothetical protein THAOC_04415 [Thalassiosira oceanica]